MKRVALLGILTVFLLWISARADEELLQGFTPQSSATERQWETKFRAHSQPRQPARIHAPPERAPAPRRLALRQRKCRVDSLEIQGMGLGRADRNISRCFSPRPKSALLEMVEPTKFTAKLQEPPVSVDPTSSQQNEQLPSYNAYSIDGDVTAPLVFVNYGLPKDYEELDRLGVSVKGRDRHRQVWQFLARHQAQSRRRARRHRLPHLLRSG